MQWQTLSCPAYSKTLVLLAGKLDTLQCVSEGCTAAGTRCQQSNDQLESNTHLIGAKYCRTGGCCVDAYDLSLVTCVRVHSLLFSDICLHPLL